MISINVYQTQVLACPAGCGMFIHQKIFAKILNHEWEKFQALTPVVINISESKQSRELVCPECNLPMIKYGYDFDKQAIIDRCPSCSKVWLDRNELEKCLEIFSHHNKWHKEWKEHEPKIWPQFNPPSH